MLGFLGHVGTAGNFTTDAQIAALARQEKAILHSNETDFQRFPGLTQAAAALNWDRDETSYHGPTRNVATLYEYWIFLQLHQMLDEIPGVSRDLDNPKPALDAQQFLTTANGEVVINLKRGKKTGAPFTVQLTRFGANFVIRA